MKKNIFINRYKQSDMIEDYKRFLNKMKDLKLYLVEFNEYDTIKNKTYLLNYVIEGKNC